MVEVAGFEPAVRRYSAQRSYVCSQCFRIRNRPRPLTGLERLLAQKSLIRRC